MIFAVNRNFICRKAAGKAVFFADPAVNPNVESGFAVPDFRNGNSGNRCGILDSRFTRRIENNNIFVAAPSTNGIKEVDAATLERVTGYMEQFEMIYGLVLDEFGEELAPLVMDMVMDRLMGMTN